MSYSQLKELFFRAAETQMSIWWLGPLQLYSVLVMQDIKHSVEKCHFQATVSDFETSE